MCGIVGYIGNRQAQPILFDCLSKLEYRGYDSCGIAIGGNSIDLYKDAIRVKALSKIAPQIPGTIGIGHTRWATHGEPCRLNAHPHCDCDNNIAVVHNGVINNFQRLREQLTAEGHNFTSETDTEIIPHLIEKYYTGNLEQAVECALRDIDGSFAIIALRAGEPRLVVARKDNPLVLGVGDREYFIASDIPALLDYTDRFIYLEDDDIGVITTDGIQIKKEGVEVLIKEEKISWTINDARKSGYEHFMIKEIHEQPKVIRDTLGEWKSAEPLTGLESILARETEAMLILACGSSFHAAMVGKYLVQDLLGIPARVEIASEFSYYREPLAATVALVITQSGETADILKTIKILKEVGCKVMVITNVLGSSAARISDDKLYTRAGPEISVAATKSFTAQLMVLYWLMMSYSRVDAIRLSGMLLGLRQMPSKVQQVLDNEENLIKHARYLSGYDNVFFMGRGINYPIALEGALKLKEISYIHAEGYAAGELKHGPFALLSNNTPVIAIIAKDNTYESMLTNIKEVKARGAPIIALAEEKDETIGSIADFVISVPKVDAIFSPIVNVVALQLLAYYTAKERCCDIDFPRNLAKSVTVE